MVKTLTHEIKFTGSVIVSDTSGQLLRLIQALIIFFGLVIRLVEILMPLLETLQEMAVSLQRLDERIRYSWPYVGYAPG